MTKASEVETMSASAKHKPYKGAPFPAGGPTWEQDFWGIANGVGNQFHKVDDDLAVAVQAGGTVILDYTNSDGIAEQMTLTPKDWRRLSWIVLKEHCKTLRAMSEIGVTKS